MKSIKANLSISYTDSLRHGIEVEYGLGDMVRVVRDIEINEEGDTATGRVKIQNVKIKVISHCIVDGKLLDSPTFLLDGIIN